MNGKPISPAEIGLYKARSFPAEVFDAFNELIVRNFSGGAATVRQDQVIELILSKTNSADRQAVFANGWLNVEEAYVAAGWKVVYDKPGYNESYEANWTFRRPS